MSRKTFITVVVIIFILIFLGLLFGYFYLNSNKQGAVGALPTQDNDGGVIGNFFSLFRKNSPATSTDETVPSDLPLGATTTVQTEEGGLVTIPRLRQISDTPTAADAFIQKDIASTTLDAKGKVKKITITETFIRFMERATGHISETKSDNLRTNKISNITVPKIYEGLFTNVGNSLLFRGLAPNNNIIETNFANLSPIKTATTTATSTPGPTGSITDPILYNLSKSPLPQNISELGISPQKDQLFYLEDSTEGSIGVIAQTNNTKQRALFSHPLQDWLIGWPSKNVITLTTKPSSEAAGFLFFLNTNNGGLTKVLGNINGLTTLTSPDTGGILYSESATNSFTLNIYYPKNGNSYRFSLKTLPEKCVWSKKSAVTLYCAAPTLIPNGSYPDNWYQGAISFNDNIWKMDVGTGARSLIARPLELAGQDMDIMNLTLDPSENYLMFINKKDLTLWNLLISPPVPVVPVAASSTATTTGTTTRR